MQWRTSVKTDTETVDDLFSLFSSTRRRSLWLYVVETEDEVFSVEELVDHLTGRDVNEDAEFEDRRRSIRTGLHHIDLPKLAAFDLIDYDERSGTVRRGDSVMGALGETLIRTSR